MHHVKNLMRKHASVGDMCASSPKRVGAHILALLNPNTRNKHLRALGYPRLLDEMVRQVGGPGNYIAMVVDSQTLNVLSSCCSVYDVLYDGVTVVELISKQRQPLPELNALYFLSPCEDSVRALITDFKDERKPQHRSAYVYFSSPIPQSSKLMTLLADAPSLLPRIRCLVEFNLSFIAYEQRVFHLGMPDALLQLFPLPAPSLLQKIAEDLISVCMTLGRRPAIRFQKNQLPWCEQVALLVHRGLQEHEPAALAYDVLEIPVCCPPQTKTKNSEVSQPMEDVYNYEVTNNMGIQEKKQTILGEQDEVWVRCRHQHIQEVNQSVQEEVMLFLKENSTVKVQQNQATSTEDTLKAIRSLPQYQEALSRYWMHVTLSENCFEKLQELKLMALGAVEQDLCCAVDKDGKEISGSKLQAAVGSLASDNTIRQDEKLRLLLLEFTQLLGLDAADRTKAVEAAQLSLVNQRVIQKFMDRTLQQVEVCCG
ncbi:syntaxin binding domain-containing protein [Cyclospora cayetanensis]|uniref:Syntaxin binding domain-containing protein n=1 Tax=Cyclospora cayetanensis TaxID=88456 RepID=A0A1D3D216_9EIME|nr:syntaxin binding domain-containing protein [Cyclospora cayetanensis]